jgi:GST-like protein
LAEKEMCMIQLYENPGWGSAIVELQLAFYGMPYRLIPVGNLFEDPDARATLAKVNPQVQVPTLVLPDGQVITQSAAITLLLADLAQSEALVPPPHAPERAAFLRWLIFIVAAIYPGFFYADVPGRFVPVDQSDAFKAKVVEHLQSSWREIEAETARHGGPFFLGKRMTAIDFFLACMVHWRPGQDWFQA